MTRQLALLLLLTVPVFAQERRQPFPDDFKSSSCASVAPVCISIAQSRAYVLAEPTMIRRYEIMTISE